MAFLPASQSSSWRSVFALVATPAVVIFVSSNLVNFGNLVFNMIFSRLMGPELFGTLALLLTIKLALLGITGALQMAVSQMIASCSERERPSVEQALARINRFLFVGIAVLVVSLAASFMLSGAFLKEMVPTAPHLLLLLLVSFPFGASLSVLRGVAFGDLKTGRIVLSANVEMGVRLVGAIVAWVLGFGIEGVVVAISLSIFAGWAVLYDLLPVAGFNGKAAQYSKTLGLAAVPFAVLQATQVIALDGDIFVAQTLLPASESGYIAALSLFQRIQFFACFALAGVLLPRVIQAAKNGENALQAAFPVFALFAVVSTLVMASAVLMPQHSITLLMGEAYAPAASSLAAAVIAAMLFTFSFLVATLLIAIHDKVGVLALALGVAIQLVIMANSDPSGFADLVSIKAICQALIAAPLAGYACLRLRRHAKDGPVGS